MTTKEAVEKLRGYQSQIIHGSNTFGELADHIEELHRTAELRLVSATRIREILSDREDLKRQRALCTADIARCRQGIEDDFMGDRRAEFQEQRRISGQAVQDIDAAIGRLNRELAKLDYAQRSDLATYFMDAAQRALSTADFEKLKTHAAAARAADLA